MKTKTKKKKKKGKSVLQQDKNIVYCHNKKTLYGIAKLKP